MRMLHALGWRGAPPAPVPPHLASWLEPIRWDADVYADVASVLAGVDMEGFRRVRGVYEHASPSPGYSKYLDIATYVAVQVRYARRLGLAPAPRARRVLDIGTGAGYFPLVCRHFGHAATAIDLDTTPMYNDLIRLFGLDRVTLRVLPRTPLPAFPHRFDLVTAMQVKFDGLRGGRWGTEEWAFFLRDLAGNVTHPDAEVFLGLNADGSGGRLPRDLALFFGEQGAVISGWEVHFPSMRAFGMPTAPRE
jgi:hypothetical protein